MIKPDPKLYYYDEEAAERACRFFPARLTFIDGPKAGQPFEPQEWEKDEIIRPIFGWKKKKDGTRKYRKVFIFVPRKNNKTTLATGIGIYMTYGFDVIGAQIFNAASTKEQAAISFDMAKKMISQDPVLMSASQIFRNSIIRKKTNGKYKVLTSDGESEMGYNTYCGILDEVHAHKDRSVADAVVTGAGTQPEPLIIFTTTAGSDRNTFCYEEYSYAKKVKSGDIDDPTYLAVIYEADETDNPFDPKTWYKCNPSLGVTVLEDAYISEFGKAQLQPSYLNICKRLYLNVWTRSMTAWISPYAWAKNNFGKVKLEDLRGKKCFLGVDLSNTNDLSALALFFPSEEKGKPHQVLMYYWVPFEKANERKAKREADYFTWRDQEYIEIVPGNTQDQEIIRKKVYEVRQIADVRTLGYDDWNASQFAIEVQSDGAVVNKWTPNNWGLWHEPSKALETLAISESLNHGGNPILSWNIENVVIRYNGEYIRPDKGQSKDKIDGVMALIMAIGEWMSYVEEEEVVFGVMTG